MINVWCRCYPSAAFALRSCVTIYFIMLFFCVGGASSALANERPSAKVFTHALEGCLRFYETHSFRAFEGWDVLQEMRRPCDSCTTLFGKIKDPMSSFVVEVELTDVGHNKGIACQSADESLGPPMEVETINAVKDWIIGRLTHERLFYVPENKRRFPHEKWKSCFRDDRPLAVSILPYKNKMSFSMHSGRPTGVNPEIPECEEL